ncbi:PepSY domain-containing protein [Solitalea longa]|nr:PepSY domain-containing protein [Solitalea longa]
MLSIIIAIPVIMWTLSGFMSPIMSSFKPKVKNQFLASKSIDLSKVKVSLDSALLKNRIECISNFRLVELDGKIYYQIRKVADNRLTYIDAQSAAIDSAAAENYAMKIAKQFLGDSTAKVTGVSFIQNFDEEYLDNNRLLPVYRVDFNRYDNTRLYVDPASDRMGLATNDSRAAFSIFFRNFHSWQFLEKLGPFRSAVLVFLAGISFITAVMGIYIVCITKSKKVNSSNSSLKYRRLHRQIGIIASITMLMFTFSGAYRAFVKLEPDTRQLYSINDEFKAAHLSFSFDSIAKRYSVKNVSLAKLNGTNYLRIVSPPNATNAECHKKDKDASQHHMEMKSLPDVIQYVSITDLKELPDGEEAFAKNMACNFSRQSPENIISVTSVTAFDDDYSMMNKRLPVYKVQFNANNNERWYVETSSGKLATKVNDVDARERFSFSKLHMFHFSHGMGKSTRDLLLVFAALVNLLAALTGTVLLVIWYKKKKPKVKLQPKTIS